MRVRASVRQKVNDTPRLAIYGHWGRYIGYSCVGVSRAVAFMLAKLQEYNLG